EAIDHMTQQVATNPGAREAQKTLAREVTKIVHGESRATGVEKVTAVLFGGESITNLSDDEIDMLAGEIPTTNGGVTIIEALVSSGVASSNGEARRLISGGAVSVNGEKVAEDQSILGTTLIKKGKNNFILVR